MNTTRYIFFFVLTLTAVVALSLSGLREVTKAQADLNEEIFNKRAILSAVEDFLPNNQTVGDLSDEDVINLFKNQVNGVVVNKAGEQIEGIQADKVDMSKERKKPESERKLPLFVYQNEGQEFYIVSVRGNGLWDEIWGNIALKGDFNTIAGAAFDHKGETPGLGAEIKDNPSFPAQFKGKEIYNDEGEYVSVKVVKGPKKMPDHQVDAISGATVTGDGVSEMMDRGIEYYLPFLNKLKEGTVEIKD